VRLLEWVMVSGVVLVLRFCWWCNVRCEMERHVHGK